MYFLLEKITDVLKTNKYPTKLIKITLGHIGKNFDRLSNLQNNSNKKDNYPYVYFKFSYIKDVFIRHDVESG